MKMTPENTPMITTVFSIAGHGFSTDDLTSLLGVEPTKIRIRPQKLDWLKSAAPDLASMGWEYTMEKQRKWSLGEAIDEVLNVFWSKRIELNEFVSKNNLRLAIRCRPFGDASKIQYIIQPQVIRKLADFSAELSLAIYKDEL
jgi:hypothetical protein